MTQFSIRDAPVFSQGNHAISEPIEPRPVFFIVGCPRSGTYLLSSILNASSRIAIPTETHFVPLFRPHLWLAGDLSRPAARKRLLRAVFIFLRIWLARAEEERDFAAVTRHSLLAVESESDRIAGSATSYAGLVCGLFASYACLQGAGEAGDKSAFFDHMPLEQIDAAMAGCARFIHVIRDGRDVCSSWRKTKVGPRSVSEAALAWSHHIEGKQAWGRLHPERYLEVRYEDLLNTPRDTLRTACAFIGFNYSDSLLDFHTTPYARDLGNSSTHPRLSQPLERANQGKWRQESTADEVSEFEAIAHVALKAVGYDLSAPVTPSGLSSKGRKNFLSSHRIRLAMKEVLPAFALCAAWVHLPLDRLCNSRIWLSVEFWLTRNPTVARGRSG